jgi:hypothetical protein
MEEAKPNRSAKAPRKPPAPAPVRAPKAAVAATSASAPTRRTTKPATTKAAATKAASAKAPSTETASTETPSAKAPAKAPRARKAINTEAIEPAEVAPAAEPKITPPASEPASAPEHRTSREIGNKIVREFGPTAAEWARWTRARYPEATPDAVARLAVLEFGRAARREAVATAAGGLAGAVAADAVLARGHARMVLAIAAAYGVDPIDPARADDLAELLAPTWRTAAGAALRTSTAAATAAVAAKIGRAPKALAGKLGAVLIAAIQSGQRTDAIAARAAKRYKNESRSLSSV